MPFLFEGKLVMPSGLLASCPPTVPFAKAASGNDNIETNVNLRAIYLHELALEVEKEILDTDQNYVAIATIANVIIGREKNDEIEAIVKSVCDRRKL